MPKDRFKSKAPVSNKPTGVSVNDILAFAAGKNPGDKLTAQDIETVITKSDIGKKDANAIRKAASKFIGSGNQFMLQGDGNYNVYGKEGQVTTQTRSTGNKVGFGAGDLVGLGNNMSKLVGLAKMYQDAFTNKDAKPANNTATKETPAKSDTPADSPPASKVGGKSGGSDRKLTAQEIANRQKRAQGIIDSLGPKDSETAEFDKVKADFDKKRKGWDEMYKKKPAKTSLEDADAARAQFYWNSPSQLMSAAGVGSNMSQLGKNIKNVGITGQGVGAFLSKYPSLNRMTAIPAAVGLAGQVAGDAIDPGKDVNWLDAATDAATIGALFTTGKALAGRKKPFQAPLPKKPTGPSVASKVSGKLKDAFNETAKKVAPDVKMPPVQTVKPRVKVQIPGETAPGAAGKPRFKIKQDGTPFKQGGKLPKGEDGIKLGKPSSLGQINVGDLGRHIKPVGMPTNAAGLAAQPTVEERSQFNAASLMTGGAGAGEGEGNGLAAFGKVAKYALPFIGTQLANKELGKVKPMNFQKANLQTGVVHDMPRPNMGLRYRVPTGNDVQTEIAGQKFADAQQRDAEANFNVANAQSRIAQRQQIVNNQNRNEMFNTQGENQARMFNASQLMQTQGIRSQNVQEPFIAAQHHLATDISTDAYLKSSRDMEGAEMILKTADPSSPQYQEALRKLGYGRSSGTPKGKKGMKFKIGK